MKGFVKCIEQNHISNLFNESTFGFVGFQDDVLVQTASYIAGTLARCYDETVLTDRRSEFIDLLRSKLLPIQFFPDSFGTSMAATPETGQDYDPTLGSYQDKSFVTFYAKTCE